jgi:hypothetical protein
VRSADDRGTPQSLAKNTIDDYFLKIELAKTVVRPKISERFSLNIFDQSTMRHAAQGLLFFASILKGKSHANRNSQVFQ